MSGFWRGRLQVFFAVLSACVLPHCLVAPHIISQTTVIQTTSTGEAAILARRGPQAFGRMTETGQVAVSGQVAIDAPFTATETRAQGISAHRVPWISGSAWLAIGIENNSEISLGCSFGSSGNAVPIASDLRASDTLMSATGECLPGVRTRVRALPWLSVNVGGELGLQFFPSQRSLVRTDSIVSVWNTGMVDTASASRTYNVRSTGVGPLGNIQFSAVAELHRILQIELGVSGGFFTSVRGVYSGGQTCQLYQTCAPYHVEDHLGVSGAPTATAWTGVTVGASPVQFVFRATATGVSAEGSTGSIFGAVGALRVVFGTPTQTTTEASQEPPPPPLDSPPDAPPSAPSAAPPSASQPAPPATGSTGSESEDNES